MTQYTPLLLACSIAICALWTLYRRSVTKCAIAGLPGPPPESFWTGNMRQLFSPAGMSFHHMLTRKYGGVVQTHGLFGDEQLFISDPRALHHILVKDQYVFEETSAFLIQSRAVFGQGLLSTLGEHHRKQRKMLNPVFSPAHMRALAPIFYNVVHQLKSILLSKVQGDCAAVDMLYWMSRAALQCIGEGGLGYDFQALDESAHNAYREATKNLLPALFSLTAYRQLITFVATVLPRPLQVLLARHAPSRRVQRIRRIVEVMNRTSREVFDEKKSALIRGVSEKEDRKDIMSILLRANMAAAAEDRLPDEELIGQMNILTFAGHDTTSSATARILYMLALHPEVQSALRAEIIHARTTYAGDLDYDRLMSLPYLDAVCRETLRLHAPSSIQQRTARKDISIPLHVPVTLASGATLNALPIKANQNVLISIAGINRSTEIWGADADEWRPARWLAPLPESVAAAKVPGVYSNVMTFLGGGRACIGFKFAELEMKVVLSVLLETFAFALPEAEIVWRLGIVQHPYVLGQEDQAAHMPLLVSLVSGSL